MNHSEKNYLIYLVLKQQLGDKISELTCSITDRARIELKLTTATQLSTVNQHIAALLEKIDYTCNTDDFGISASRNRQTRELVTVTVTKIDPQYFKIQAPISITS